MESSPATAQDNPYSSPIVVGEKVIITLAMNKGPEHHVLCFNKNDGKPLWDTLVPPGEWILKDVRGGYRARRLHRMESTFTYFLGRR